MIPFTVVNMREPMEYDTYWGVPNEYRGKSWWERQQTVEYNDVYFPWRHKDRWYDMYMLFRIKSIETSLRARLFQAYIFPHSIYKSY